MSWEPDTTGDHYGLIPGLLPPCPKCGSTTWDRPVPGRHNLIIKVWGPSIRICHGCGSVRYPEEIEVNEN